MNDIEKLEDKMRLFYSVFSDGDITVEALMRSPHVHKDEIFYFAAELFGGTSARDELTERMDAALPGWQEDIVGTRRLRVELTVAYIKEQLGEKTLTKTT